MKRRTFFAALVAVPFTPLMASPAARAAASPVSVDAVTPWSEACREAAEVQLAASDDQFVAGLNALRVESEARLARLNDLVERNRVTSLPWQVFRGAAQ